MKIIRHTEKGYDKKLAGLNRRYVPDPEVAGTVAGIMQDVAKRGDRAVIEYVHKFGGPKLRPAGLRLAPETLQSSWKALDRETKKALRTSLANVKDFARYSMRKNWWARNRQGARVSERFDPFRRVGIYVPGGTAPLVSTAIMTCGFATAARVPEIVVTTPCDADGNVNSALLGALHIAGASEVYKVGGAQAIAALALGTKTVGKVDKVFGPGNAYVVEAKRQAFGAVAVDLLPGPSEILILADSSANPAWVAADLLAQAEHGSRSAVGLVTTSSAILKKVQSEIEKQLTQLTRCEHLRPVLEKDTFLILAKSLDQAVDIVNGYAPEHVSLALDNAAAIAKRIHTAGAIFVGHLSPVAAGDFMAGPSHELPTGGAGKSFPGLTADMFQRRTSFVEFTKPALERSVPIIEKFAELEGLDAHGRSASIRV